PRPTKAPDRRDAEAIDVWPRPATVRQPPPSARRFYVHPASTGPHNNRARARPVSVSNYFDKRLDIGVKSCSARFRYLIHPSDPLKKARITNLPDHDPSRILSNFLTQ